MSVRLWGYEAEKCDGDYCPNDCDRCYKADKTAEDLTVDALEYKGVYTARPAEECVYPNCEECDKYHGHYCTVPMVVSKQNYRLTQDLLAQMGKRLTDLENLVTDEILRSDKGITIPSEVDLNLTWGDYLGEEK